MTTWRTILSFETDVLQRVLNFAHYVDWEGWKQNLTDGVDKAIPLVMMNKKTIRFEPDIKVFVAEAPYKEFQLFEMQRYTQYGDPPGMSDSVFHDTVNKVYGHYRDVAQQHDLDLAIYWRGQYGDFVDLVLTLKT